MDRREWIGHLLNLMRSKTRRSLKLHRGEVEERPGGAVCKLILSSDPQDSLGKKKSGAA